MKRWSQNRLFSLACLSGFFACQPSPAAPVDTNLQERIVNLPGYWHGQAIETPVGPMNYDIQFHDCKDGSVAGVAATGASLHYWKFKLEGETPSLRFLSTFRGNRKPTRLLSEHAKVDLLSLTAPELDLLSLKIHFSDNKVDIQVFHHDKPHVRIRLDRSESSPELSHAHHDRTNSCRGAPD